MSADRPTFPETYVERRVEKFILGLRKTFQDLPYGSPQVEALRDFSYLITLAVSPMTVTTFQEIEIAKKEENNAEYKATTRKLSRRAGRFLQRETRSPEVGKILSNKLGALIDELHSKHIQR
jgi:hypothetical protein